MRSFQPLELVWRCRGCSDFLSGKYLKARSSQDFDVLTGVFGNGGRHGIYYFYFFDGWQLKYYNYSSYS